MTRLSRRAERQFDALTEFYERKNRPEATRNLIASVERASAVIERAPERGLQAPRPYPQLVKPGRLWIKEGAYWFAFASTPGPIITGIFHEGSDIPGRL